MFGGVFKPRANYVFDYKPRYYNERKERLQKLEEKYHGKKTDSEDYKVTLTRDNLRSEWNRNKHLAHDKKTNLRLAIIIAILVGLFAFIFLDHKLF